jgi:hypothetical protein
MDLPSTFGGPGMYRGDRAPMLVRSNMSVTSAFTPRIGDAESLPGGRLSASQQAARGAGPGGERTDGAVGVDVGGGTDPVSPHCSMSYSAEVDLQQTDGPYVL